MAPGVGSYRKAHWGPLKSLLALSPILIAAPLLAVWQHNDLPTPLTELVDPRTNLPQISEARILDIARYLSEDIGYRTVGTYEHALADDWLHGQVLDFQKECQKAADAAAGMGIGGSGGRKLECEVWRQQGSGSHRFDMMGKRVYKTYVNLTNIIVRISNGTPKGKQNAILVNAHLDSTLPSPGAADDAICVGVMMDVMRVLVGTPGWSPEHAIIFLFNNAEESLQDGSHLFSTQHPTAPTVRTVINLEAAGTSGRELLFQATSEQMVQAYSHVPRPYGTILANDIFRSGFILSDTDFRQFEYYLNVTGLDMAFIGNSYLYHMRKDTVENIGKGAGQHMGENVLALVKYLSSIVSPLPTLAEGYTPPSTVFFSHIRIFVAYSFTTAKIMYSALFIASLIMIRLQKNGGLWKEQLRGVLAVTSAHVGGVVVPNIVAFVMTKVLGKGMSWFANEYSAIALYGFPMLLGVLLSQYLFGPVSEHTILTSLLLVDSAFALVLQSVGIGSAVFFFILSLPLFVALLLNPLFVWGNGRISLMTYVIGYPLPILTTTMLMLPVIEFFVPLTGRIGAEAPADNIIATIVSVLGFKTVSFVLPFAHRFGRKSLGRAVALFSVFTVLVMAIFAARAPFDEMHQKRMFIIHSKNITSNERHLHISGADSAPGLEDIVNEVAYKFVKSEEEPALIEMNDDNPDWASLYPFSSFLTAYRIPLPGPSRDVSSWTDRFTVMAENDIRHVENGTRSLTLKVYHPGLIWTVIAFDAHVLQWSLDDFPPDEYSRHHIREASFYQIDTWSVDLVLNTTSSPRGNGLRIDFIGIEEEGMWPGKQARIAVENRGEALRLFEELDGWMDDRLGGTADALLMSTVAGVANI